MCMRECVTVSIVCAHTCGLIYTVEQVSNSYVNVGEYTERFAVVETL